MNPLTLTLAAVAIATLPFALGTAAASWRHRRAVARQSRILTLEFGPKVLLGLSLSAAPAVPALAAGSQPASVTTAALPTLDRGPIVQAATQPTIQPPPAHPRVHTVRPGETLWSITAQALGPHASGADIARTWPKIWAANRDIIGADPSLVFPGQRLAIPAGNLS